MTTLSRDRRKKFEEIIITSDIYHYALSNLENLGQGEFAEQMVKDLSTALAEAAQSRSEIRGIEAAMFGDRPVTEADLPIADEALKAFERDMQCPGNWSWYPAKSTLEKEWKALREFVVKLYVADQTCFEGYHTWRNQPYVKGAMSNLSIKNNPANFEASWSDYMAQNKKTDGEQGDYRPRISA